MKIYDGTTWQEAKTLKVHTGSSWASAIKGWVYNNGWQLAYPNYPVLVSGPTLSISGTLYPTVGTTYTANATWNMDPAYAPTSYTYKWYRSGSEISGATSQTYLTTTADIDKIISVQITATNGRGSTPVTNSYGATVLPTVASLTAYDSTITPTASINLYVNGLSYSGSWSSNNATSVSVTSTNGSIYPDSSGQSGNYTGTGNANPITVYATPVNSNKQVYMTWTAAPGAASYDVVRYGNNTQTTINLPSSQTNYTWSLADDNPNNYISVYPRSAAGIQGYGIQTTVSTSNKTGTSASASSNLYEPYPTAPSNIYGSDDVNPTGGTFYWTASTSPIGRSITGYSYTIYQNGSYYTSGSTAGTSVQVSASGSFSISVTASDGIFTSQAGSGSASFTSKVTAPTQPSPYGIDNISPTGGTFYWGASSATGGGTIGYSYTIYRNGSYYSSGVTTNTSIQVIAAGSMEIYVYAYNTVGNSGTGYASATFTGAPVVVAPTISVSNNYDGYIGGKYQWTLTITNTSSSAATSYNWGVQFSASNGGTVVSSATGSGGSIPAGGSVTVTRNHATATWARWVSITASNSAGTSSTAATGWS
jgi:hypothetical protein